MNFIEQLDQILSEEEPPQTSSEQMDMNNRNEKWLANASPTDAKMNSEIKNATATIEKGLKKFKNAKHNLATMQNAIADASVRLTKLTEKYNNDTQNWTGDESWLHPFTKEMYEYNGTSAQYQSMVKDTYEEFAKINEFVQQNPKIFAKGSLARDLVLIGSIGTQLKWVKGGR